MSEVELDSETLLDQIKLLEQQVADLRMFTVEALIKFGMLSGYVWNHERREWDKINIQTIEDARSAVDDLPVYEGVSDGEDSEGSDPLR